MQLCLGAGAGGTPRAQAGVVALALEFQFMRLAHVVPGADQIERPATRFQGGAQMRAVPAGVFPQPLFEVVCDAKVVPRRDLAPVIGLRNGLAKVQEITGAHGCRRAAILPA